MIYRLTVNNGDDEFSITTKSDLSVIRFLAFLNSKDIDVFGNDEHVSVDLDLLRECEK